MGRVPLLCRKGESRLEVPSFDLDGLTVNVFLGSDCAMPFVTDCLHYGKGIFCLDKTSNPSAGELQDLLVLDEESQTKTKLSERVAHLINKWGEGTDGIEGYRSVGAVVGATYAGDATNLRTIMPNNIFLVPGLYTQGGQPEDIPNFVNKSTDSRIHGRGAIVNSSREIIYAYRKPEWSLKHDEEEFAEASREKAIKMKKDLTAALRNAQKSRW